MPDADRDLFYAGLLVAGGVLVGGLGVWARRVMLVTIASGALILTLVIQYFAKLVDFVPWGFLALGFGLALLGAAVATVAIGRCRPPRGT